MEKKKEYIKYNKETKEYSILLKYSPEDIMDGDYYYKVGRILELDELIDIAIGNSMYKAKADYNDNTIKWFREFFLDDELVEMFNEDICKIIYDTDEDFAKRIERRIELFKPVNWRE